MFSALIDDDTTPISGIPATKIVFFDESYNCVCLLTTLFNPYLPNRLLALSDSSSNTPIITILRINFSTLFQHYQYLFVPYS